MAADQVNESAGPQEPAGLPTTDWFWYLRPFETNGVIETWPDATTPDLPTTALDHHAQPRDVQMCSLLADQFLRMQQSAAEVVDDPPVIAYEPYIRDMFDPLSSDLQHTVSKKDMHSADLSKFVIGVPTLSGRQDIIGWWIRVATSIDKIGAAYVQVSRHDHTRHYTVDRVLKRIGATPGDRHDLRQAMVITPQHVLAELLGPDLDW